MDGPRLHQGRHLDEGTWIGPTERFFEIADCLGLDFPEAGFVELGEGLQSGAKLRRLCDPVGQCFGPGDCRLRGKGSRPLVK